MHRLDRLAPCTVLDLVGNPVRLGDVWHDGPTVLVFIRHFG
jgi:hypothetical protein